MSGPYDVVIIGLGAMGSAAAYHLARRGRRVVGFDAAEPPHALGSTHGESRIIREAYFEHPLYVPIVQRSYECWNALQTECGETLLHNTGGLLLGTPDGTLIAGTRLSADRHGLDYEMLAPAEVRRRFPAIRPSNGTAALYEPRAGILMPEKCVGAHLTLADRHGAELHYNEPVREWKPKNGGVQCSTEAGTYEAAQLLLTPGAWMNHFVPDLDLPLVVERQVLHWFETERPEDFTLGTLPIYAWEYAEAALFYGFPDLGTGAKLALHHQGIVTDVESIDREVHEEELDAIRGIAGAYVRGLGANIVRSEVCMYTNTPDEHFLIDFHPDLPQVLIASPCSGHGFKFAAAIGEILTDLLTRGKSAFDLSPFRLDRFDTSKA